ncbi:MAG: NUDIX domain-containing protein [Alphaproteobacteria bacterium]|nr:NUDIX domain-containing protein [Alphaproteobacteria bacterium]
MIEIVAAVILDGRGRVLLVRKRGTGKFMQPGGKREAGESDLAALARELREELGCGFDPAEARWLGRARAPAANEPGETVEAALYLVRLTGDAVAAAEIDAMVWADPAQAGDLALAPLTEQAVLPLVGKLFGPAAPASTAPPPPG